MAEAEVPSSPFFGNEFEYLNSDLMALTNGQFVGVTVFSERVAETNNFGYSVFAQIFNYDGTLAGPEMTVTYGTEPNVNRYDGFEINDAGVVGLADGGFVVTWRATDFFKSPTRGEFAIDASDVQKFRVFNADGTARTTELELSIPQPVPKSLAVEMTPFKDGFLAVWDDKSDDASNPSSFGVVARAFDKDGKPLEHPTLDDPEYINGVRDGNQIGPEVDTLTDGGIVVAYEDGGGDGGGDIVVKVFDKSGNPLTDDTIAHEVTAGYQFLPSLTALADGRFAVAGISYNGLGGVALFAQILSIDRTGASATIVRDSPLIQLAQKNEALSRVASPKIIGTAGSGFFAAWSEFRADSANKDVPSGRVMGQFFNADGTKNGAALQIAEGYIISSGEITLAESKDGAIFVNWGEYLQETAEFLGAYFVPHSFNRVVKAPVEAPVLKDLIYGTENADTLTGKDINETIFGYGDKDMLDGGKGADTMYGGKGNDTYTVDNKGDKIVEKRGEGLDLVKASVGFVLASEVENLTLTGKANIAGTGNGLANTMTGNAGKNVLDGGKGADTLNAGAGDDKLIGGLGADKLSGGPGNDTFIFTSVKDSTVATAGRDTVFDFAKGDKIDLSEIDASTKIKGNQSFSFIETAGFSKTAGELRYEKKASDTYIYGDINGDGKADFAIHLDDAVVITKGLFIL